jgi:ribonuclease P protein subunit RPR2
MNRKKKQFHEKKEAINHINELFELAKQNFPGELSKRNIELVREYATRFNIKLAPEIKRNFCKECNTILIVGKTSRVRIKPGKKPIKIVTCLECGTVKRIGFTKPKSENKS